MTKELESKICNFLSFWVVVRTGFLKFEKFLFSWIPLINTIVLSATCLFTIKIKEVMSNPIFSEFYYTFSFQLESLRNSHSWRVRWRGENKFFGHIFNLPLYLTLHLSLHLTLQLFISFLPLHLTYYFQPQSSCHLSLPIFFPSSHSSSVHLNLHPFSLPLNLTLHLFIYSSLFIPPFIYLSPSSYSSSFHLTVHLFK